MRIRTLSEADVRKCISMRDAISLMRKAFPAISNGDVEVPLRTMIRNDLGTILYKPAYWSRAGLFCQKIVSVFPSNAEEQLPVTTGMIQANSADNGLPIATMDAGFITSLRTGAATALAVDFLTPESIDTACLFGVGGQARHQLEALVEIRDFKTVFVVSRSERSARDFCESANDLSASCELRYDVGPEIIKECQVIVTATTSQTPVVDHSQLPDKVMISAIGSLGPNNTEIAPETILDAGIVVDQRSACLAEAGEFFPLIEDGRLPKNFQPPELGEIVAKTQKAPSNPRIVFKSVGNAAQDIFCVEHVLAYAETNQIGQFVEL